MELELSEYQEVLRATTRDFLEAESPVTAVRALADDPPASTLTAGRPGAALGWTSLLVDPADGGGSVSGNGMLGPGDRRRGARPDGGGGSLRARQRRGGRARLVGPPGAPDAPPWAASWPATSSRRGRTTSTAGLAPTRLEPGRSGTLRPDRAQGAGRGRSPGRCLLVSARSPKPGLVQVVVPADAPGVTVTPRGVARPRPAVRRRALRRRHGVARRSRRHTPTRRWLTSSGNAASPWCCSARRPSASLDRVFGFTLE